VVGVTITDDAHAVSAAVLETRKAGDERDDIHPDPGGDSR